MTGLFVPYGLLIPLCAALAYRSYRAASAAQAPLHRQLLRWHARGWALSALGACALPVPALVARFSAAAGWRSYSGFDLAGLFAIAFTPLAIGLTIVGISWLAGRAYCRYPGPVANADRDLWPRSPRRGA